MHVSGGALKSLCFCYAGKTLCRLFAEIGLILLLPFFLLGFLIYTYIVGTAMVANRFQDAICSVLIATYKNRLWHGSLLSVGLSFP